MKGYYYAQGMCKSKKSPYNGLYPVEVERKNGSDSWEIKQMACSMKGTEGCVLEECEIWKKISAMNVLPDDIASKVRENKL